MWATGATASDDGLGCVTPVTAVGRLNVLLVVTVIVVAGGPVLVMMMVFVAATFVMVVVMPMIVTGVVMVMMVLMGALLLPNLAPKYRGTDNDHDQQNDARRQHQREKFRLEHDLQHGS